MGNIITKVLRRAARNQLTITQLAEISGVSKSTLYRWGKQLPKCLEEYEKIRTALHEYEKNKNPKP